MRRRFNPCAVASSDGTHVMVSHDTKCSECPRRQLRQFARLGALKVQVTSMQAAMLARNQLIMGL
jgi:hypothetical protein